MTHGTGAAGRQRAPQRRASRLRGVWAGLIAILAVLVGILVVNLINGKPDGNDPTRPVAAATRTPSGADLGSSGAAKPSATRPATPTHSSSPSPSPSTTPPALPASAPPERPASSPSGLPGAAVTTPITVLNKSTIKGLAESTAKQLTEAGFQVSRTGNFQSTYNVPVPTVFYADDQEAAAQKLKDAIPGIQKIVPRSQTRIVVDDPLILVITRDFPAEP
ncbi:LytR/CpsA/Psr regulator C-terminal domain-containing protein [Frankia sp. AiPs1]|uniref:LytR C-terminal domain-containing protein n=1 Tax=Frankia sp. AiPa1 TaxID=573492 RepID=UPI00202B0A0E|nr:LytR C-terminal domain-containing protein [Frankia sp. AiPa1]MCL9759431.1 LytR C-terminal domain-containing protein [Frankia sp. AiPa1]